MIDPPVPRRPASNPPGGTHAGHGRRQLRPDRASGGKDRGIAPHRTGPPVAPAIGPAGILQHGRGAGPGAERWEVRPLLGGTAPHDHGAEDLRRGPAPAMTRRRQRLPAFKPKCPRCGGAPRLPADLRAEIRCGCGAALRLVLVNRRRRSVIPVSRAAKPPTHQHELPFRHGVPCGVLKSKGAAICTPLG